MTRDAHLPGSRRAASPVAPALAALRRLPPPGARVRLVAANVAPAAIELIAVATLVLFHHLPALLVAAGIKDTLHD